MTTKEYKVTMLEGKDMPLSFEKSFVWDWSEGDIPRIVAVDCSDKTGSNKYIIVRITKTDAHACDCEMWGQESDGLLENEPSCIVEGYADDFFL